VKTYHYHVSFFYGMANGDTVVTNRKPIDTGEDIEALREFIASRQETQGIPGKVVIIAFQLLKVEK
jgi:hypothetical protein